MTRVYVLTGGPGGGKSTLVERLAALGYATTAEASRALLRAGEVVDRHDAVAFSEAILAAERRSYAWALTQPGPVFCDRGVPDVAGNYVRDGEPVPPHVEAAVRECPYERTVFVAPPWREIYVNDEERIQGWDEAVRTHDAMVAVYLRYGYEPVPLPFVPVEERVVFVLERVAP